MKLTPVLYVRSLLAKLHPPMPATPQENQQLLSLLSLSFKRRLDDAHPPIETKKPHYRAKVPVSGPVVDNFSARAIMDHLHSLLQHPLLAQNALVPSKTQLPEAEAAIMMDQAMLRGEADLGVVVRCMEIYIKTVQDANVAVNDEYRLGRRISAWFMSSNAANKEKFLSSTKCLRNAVPILYAEGLEEVVWEWLRMLYGRKIIVGNFQGQASSNDNKKRLNWVLQESHLTFLMIKEALRRSRLDAAVLQLIQAAAYMQSTGRMLPEVRSSPPWRAATNAITKALLRRRHGHGLSARLFDRFLEQRSLWSDRSTFDFELICLYHPRRPSARELVIALGEGKEEVKVRFNQIKSMSEPARKIILNSLLDGAQLLLEQAPGAEPNARLILDLIEMHFPTFADAESSGTTPKRIQSVRHTITPQQAMPAPIGIT